MPFRDRTSFTSKYLLVPYITKSGREYGIHLGQSNHHHGTASLDDSRNEKWSSPVLLFLHCIEKALASEAEDFNGDIQLMEYLLYVIVEDLNCRLAASSALKQNNSASAASILSRRRALIENSIAWRIFAGNVRRSCLFIILS